jgi:hypothetical protein
LRQQTKKLRAAQTMWIECRSNVHLTRIQLPKLIPTDFVREASITTNPRRETQAPQPPANQSRSQWLSHIPCVQELAKLRDQLPGPNSDPLALSNPVNKYGQQRGS